MAVITKALMWMVKMAGFDSWSAVVDSMFPSYAKNTTVLLVSIAGVYPMLEMFFGLKGLTIIAFAAMLSIELISGIMASKLSGKVLDSKRVPRFIFKLFLWLCCFFIVESFQKQYDGDNTLVAAGYEWLHAAIMIYVSQEYLISILENIAVISNRSNLGLIRAIRRQVKKFLNADVETLHATSSNAPATRDANMASVQREPASGTRTDPHSTDAVPASHNAEYQNPMHYPSEHPTQDFSHLNNTNNQHEEH